MHQGGTGHFLAPIPGKGARQKRLAASGRTGLEVQREVLDTLLVRQDLKKPSVRSQKGTLCGMSTPL